MSKLGGQHRQIDVAGLQWIAVKKRLKRIACGHFHGSSQPAAEGSCEKKMNSARPTRFSAGTYQPSWSRSRGVPEKSRNIRRARLSSETSRLSPMTKEPVAGTRNSGVSSALPLSVDSTTVWFAPLGSGSPSD